MQKIIGLVIAFSTLFSACGVQPVLTATPAAPTISPAPLNSTTPSATLPPTNTLTPAATTTPASPTVSPTRTRTPLPTISTFTPTFDARTIVTATPAPKAECPKEDPELEPNFPYCDANGFCDLIYNDELLLFLNSGGSLGKANRVLTAHSYPKSADLTGDGLEEIILPQLGGILIDGCKDGKYQNLFVFEWDFSGQLENVIDLNKDGMPELIFLDFYSHGDATIHIYEWDGGEMRSLIKVGDDDKVFLTSMYKIRDVNGDGLKEIVIVQNYKEFEKKVTVGSNLLFVMDPYRDETIALGWSGQYFVNLKQGNYTAAKYRFQAIQDGDSATLYGEYQRALTLYQAVIFDNRLEWWSAGRESYELGTYSDAHKSEPTPIPDTTEYPRLAAYAYYRMLILHTYLGEMESAQIKYATLREKFPVGQAGHPYAEMANDFWNAYQSSGQMYAACAAAIAYADAHPEILTPLGSDYHGAQSHIYVPADVCPFR